MNIRELVCKNRSYRRFDQRVALDRALLSQWVDLARLSASARNLQCLKYYLSYTDDQNAQIFQTLSWAGYLPDWPGPEEGERPSAYIVMLNDTAISSSPGIDPGIAAQSILLGAAEAGFGGCMLMSFKKAPLQAILQLPEHLVISLVLALGKPVETVVIEAQRDTDCRYWRDAAGVHHVPKRALEELLLN